MSWKRVSFLSLYVLFVLVLIEAVVRGAWAVLGVPFFEAPIRFHHYWYPELVEVESLDVRRDDETFDVLLLGGSVLQTSDLGERLGRALGDRLGRPTRIHNVCEGGHTSLDSFYKYRRLADQRFDLVFFYHAINEERANLCPAEVFRSDYSHYSWYRLIRDYEEGDRQLLALPYTLHFAHIKLAGKTGLITFVPKHWPGPESLAHGGEIKTEASFRHNLERIAALAAERGDPLVVATFATHLAEGYSDAKFEANELDYAPGGFPIALWGSPDHVVRAVEVHNDVARELAARESFHLVDLAAQLPRGARYFSDICHLTDEGNQQFADRVVLEIGDELR